MSKIAELLARKRAAMIDGADATAVDIEIHAAQRRAQRTAIAKDDASRKRPESQSMWISGHARRRMAQRGLTTRDVYAVWKHGEPSSSYDDTVFHMTAKVFQDAPASARKLRGVAIVVGPPNLEKSPRPVLKTVLADGEDTTFARTP